MKDADGSLADYIAMATLCRRLAVALQASSPERLDEVLRHASREADRALAVKVSLCAAESSLLKQAARSQITFIETIYNWVRPHYPVRTQANAPQKVSQSA